MGTAANIARTYKFVMLSIFFSCHATHINPVQFIQSSQPDVDGRKYQESSPGKKGRKAG